MMVMMMAIPRCSPRATTHSDTSISCHVCVCKGMCVRLLIHSSLSFSPLVPVPTLLHLKGIIIIVLTKKHYARQ